MATMVLTAVGSAVGGPIGAAIGSLVGQYLDREVIFRPKRREGARLADLRIQASSYGVAIPLLFGTMRVAGSVIWSTDLIERRSDTRAGKGSPTVTQYSYAASFAVLLSGRPIVAVGRVWADGKLLRGAAGDMKAAGAMRVHLGGEDQPVDPLIASAEGAEAPAHRGSAYAVFENLALADFGNRIPSLTFEVVADGGPVTAGTVARALAPEVAGELDLALDGFAAEGDAGAVVAMLAMAAGGWVAAADGGMLLAGDAPVATVIGDDGVVLEPGARRRGRSVAAVEEVPRAVSVGHFDPARDWQAGNQRAVRAGTGRREQRVALPAALTPAAAKAVAATLLARAEVERTRRTVAPGLAGWALRPGQVVGVAGEDGRWRVERIAIERMAAIATLVPVAPATRTGPATGGRAVVAADLVAGTTILHATELPPLGDGALAQPRLVVVAAGSGAGWRGSPLLLSLDGGASWEAAGSTAAPGVVGTVTTPPGAASTGLVDRRHEIEVVLAHAGMALTDADAAALDQGANLALVGDELVQFGRAIPLGDERWRLGELWRGRRGTEHAVGAHATGERFALIDAAAVRTVDLPPSVLGATVRVMAAGVGDGVDPPTLAVPVTGASVAPPAPVDVRARMTGEGVALRWTRRSRDGWQWRDGGEVPLGEEREAYRVGIVADDGEAWEALVDAPALTIPADRHRGRGLAIAVRQQGTRAESPPATLTIPAS